MFAKIKASGADKGTIIRAERAHYMNCGMPLFEAGKVYPVSEYFNMRINHSGELEIVVSIEIRNGSLDGYDADGGARYDSIEIANREFTFADYEWELEDEEEE